MEVIYVMDPMCSWCWGFRPALRALLDKIHGQIPVRYVMGGLAPDSDEPMPRETREYVQSQWRAVTEATGARFNWDFWEKCRPRRSTYPACRAVIAAGMQDPVAIPGMIRAIQGAYYEQARNPSDIETLAELAADIGLDQARFKQDMAGKEVEDRLQADFETRRRLGVTGFPTVLLEKNGDYVLLGTGRTTPDEIVRVYTDSV